MISFSNDIIEETISKIQFDKLDGLLPIVVQDNQTKDLLMLAFMDREALRLTLSTGKAHYWSRTRKTLWRKGETSGHEQIVEKLFLDCDYDTLLLQVNQIGVCCHTGEKTCFHNTLSEKGQQ
jgi:phosphoribosyl-ATP pyrophosphohydrolase/phosphoribosyl-AMP cyclohydrolase